MVVTNHRKHNRDCFYKYTSATTALKILESSAVRYSSPLEFNDPFDVQSGLHIDFNTEELPDKIMDRFEQLILQDAPPPDFSLGDSHFAQAVCAMRKLKATMGTFPKEWLRQQFRSDLIGLTQEMITLQRQLQDKWWRDFLPRLRVFCVSEEKDNLLMWAHYARDHTGAVFEFRALAEQDNPLCVAKPIRYCSIPPPLFSEAKEINTHLSLLGEVDENTLMADYAYIKSDIWAYEKEWRVLTLMDEAGDKLHSEYPVYPNEIGAVYFGCRIDPDNRTKILRLLSGHPNAKVFQARRALDKFKLDFDAI
jgi:hypothetical protein